MSNRQHKQDLFDGMKAPVDHEKIWTDLVQHPDFPHEKKKRRGLLWFFFGLAAVVVAAGIYFYTQSDYVSTDAGVNASTSVSPFNSTTSNQSTTIQLPSENPLHAEREEHKTSPENENQYEVKKASTVKIERAEPALPVQSEQLFNNSKNNKSESLDRPLEYPLHIIKQQEESYPVRPTAYDDLIAEGEQLAAQYARTTQVKRPTAVDVVGPLTALYIVPLEYQAQYDFSLSEAAFVRRKKSSAKRHRTGIYAGGFYAVDQYNRKQSAAEPQFAIDSDASHSYGAEFGIHRTLPKQFFVEAGALYRRSRITHVNQRSIISYELADNSGAYLFNAVRAVERNSYKSTIDEWDARLLVGKSFFMSKVRPFVAVGAGYRLSDKSSTTNTTPISEDYSLSTAPYYFGRAGAQVSLNASFDLMTYLETHLNRTYRLNDMTKKYENYPVQVGLQLGYRF